MTQTTVRETRLCSIYLGNYKVISQLLLNVLLQMSERCELSVYQTFYYYRGRLVDEDFEPPSNFTDRFLDHLTAGLIHPGWSEERQQIITHACKAECALETVIIMGRPYTKDVKEAVDW